VPEDTEATDPDGAAWRVSSCPTWRAVPGRRRTLTVPVSISGASQLFTVSLTVTFDPSVLRVRTVQEGGSMRLGGAQVASRSKSILRLDSFDSPRHATTTLRVQWDQGRLHSMSTAPWRLLGRDPVYAGIHHLDGDRSVIRRWVLRDLLPYDRRVEIEFWPSAVSVS